MTQVTLVFSDGQSLAVPAGTGDVVYQAALRHGIQLATDCREGACGTCKAFCTSGRYRHRDFSEDALSPDEERQGYVLSCQMQPESDCVVEFSYPAADALMRRSTARRSATVRAVEPVAARVVRLAVDFGPARPAFLPGQYVKIQVPGTSAWRSFSFANAPTEGGKGEFFIRVLESGAMSNYVSGRAAEGHTLEIEGAFGHFYFRPSARPVLMVAGGTGLAPMLSMLDEMQRTGHRPLRLALLYGVTRPDEFFGLERLERHADALGLALRLASVEAGGPEGTRTGLVTDLLDEAAGGADSDVYLCGPPGMIVAAQTKLQQRGVTPGRIFAEKFIPSG